MKGGKRRHHVPPKLGMFDVIGIRLRKMAGFPVKRIMKRYRVSKDTIYRVINRTGAYK